MSRHASSCDEHLRYTAGCTPCQARARRYAYERHWGIYGGTWEGCVEGERLEAVKEHLRALLAEPGVTVPRIAAVAGTGHSNIYRLLSGKTVEMQGATAAALLGVTAERARAVGQRQFVDSTGAARRLRALLADGWSSESLSALCGVNPVTLSHWRAQARKTIRADGHETVVQLYEKIQALADPRGPSDMARRRAQEFGYLPPECWADGDLDDPDAEPLPRAPESEDWVAVTQQIDAVLRTPLPGAGAHLDRHVKREVARQASKRLGWSYERIAEVLGYKSTNTVEYLLGGRRDRPHTQRPIGT